MKTFGKFGLKDAERALGVLKAKKVSISAKDAAMLAALIEAMGVQNVAGKQAREEATRAGATVAEANRAALAAEARGVTRAEAFRKRCDSTVAAVNDLVKKIVDGIAAHYRAAVARAEARAEATAELHRNAARDAEKARNKAAEIADLF